MNDKRREILLGYLLGALEPDETAKVEAELHTDTVLRDDLDAISRDISPINAIADDYEPPVGLAMRTCKNLWAAVDSAQNSPIASTLPVLPSFCKKRRITVVLSQDDNTHEEASEVPYLQPHFTVPCEPEPQDLHTDAVIPLSRALLVSAPAKPRKPNEIRRRVDQAENATGEPHLYSVDSMEIVRRHPPKYYGRDKKKEEKISIPWTTRDIFASLLVGLTAAVVIFPLIQMGLGNFREMIIQKKLENVAKTMAPSTSQYSLSGFSPNDLRVLAGMNLDTQSANMLHGQQDSTASPFAGLQENTIPSSSHPVIFPVGLSGRNSDANNPSQ